MALDTVQDYLNITRALLLDEVVPYRWSDATLVTALNTALLEARKLRADLFLGVRTIPTYADVTAPVKWDPQYRMALVYYMCGQAQLRDDEATQDSRAAVFLNKFTSQLVTLAA